MKDKFHSARLRLTAWYLLIIMVISILFSVAFFNTATNELERVINRIQFREQHPHEKIPNRPPPSEGHTPPTLEDLQESKNRLVLILVIINGAIFVFAGGAGYFLAGRTLLPIKLMMDEQNQFITSSSHELRTPIATMRAEMEGSLLEKHISDKQARELIMSNLEELGGIQELTNNLLKLAQIHNTDTAKQREDFTLTDLIQIAEKKVLSLAKKRQITISTNVKEAIVTGDKSRLAEVFVILLDNAIKYSPEKTTVHITSETVRNHAKISISDQGIGIDEKDLPHIFNRFYRADQSRSQTEGFGLGLSIAQTIVETHGGSIQVKSKIQHGTTFIVTLPIKHA
jgi:two-component system sensor histidine kinase CiaH